MKNKWLEKLKRNPIPWLLESNPWTRHRTLIDLLNYPETDNEVVKAKADLIKRESYWIS